MKCDCGRLISRHMQGKCLACRYAEVKETEMMKKVRVKTKRICKYCGKEFYPTTNSNIYCGDYCKRHAQLEQARKKNQKIVKRMCIHCGKDFETKKGSSRQLCPDCKRWTTGAHTKQPPVDRTVRAEKMRKIKASGMTYGQYLVHGGIKPKDPIEMRGTKRPTDAWMTGPDTIEVKPSRDTEPKARLKIKRFV